MTKTKSTKYNPCCRDCKRGLARLPLAERLEVLCAKLIDGLDFEHAVTVRDAMNVLRKAGHLTQEGKGSKE